MGYFSNGTEGEGYEERYCRRCVHYGPDGPGCAIWAAHLLHNADRGNEMVAEILDLLIPRSPGGIGNEQCRLFLEPRS